jgi:hypothetical protein
MDFAPVWDQFAHGIRELPQSACCWPRSARCCSGVRGSFLLRPGAW